MLRISVVDGARRRRIVVEGALVAPWMDELVAACEEAKTDLESRELVVDLRGVTAFSSEGETVLLRLMRDEIRFESGLFMSEILKQLARAGYPSRRKADDA